MANETKPNSETLEGIAKVLGYRLGLVKELQEGDSIVERTDRGITHSVVKGGKLVEVKQEFKAKAPKDISKIDLVEKAKALPRNTGPNVGNYTEALKEAECANCTYTTTKADPRFGTKELRIRVKK